MKLDDRMRGSRVSCGPRTNGGSLNTLREPQDLFKSFQVPDLRNKHEGLQDLVMIADRSRDGRINKKVQGREEKPLNPEPMPPLYLMGLVLLCRLTKD